MHSRYVARGNGEAGYMPSNYGRGADESCIRLQPLSWLQIQEQYTPGSVDMVVNDNSSLSSILDSILGNLPLRRHSQTSLWPAYTLSREAFTIDCDPDQRDIRKDDRVILRDCLCRLPGASTFTKSIRTKL